MDWINVGNDTFNLAHVLLIEELPEGRGVRVHFSSGAFPVMTAAGEDVVQFREYRDRQAELIRRVLDQSARSLSF